ncbi:nucleotide exchange factor GrpE [Hippea jasoniae]|uniref:nucleotide exchange factor GrpE n=1 Tax=Hippea jasoniae TaxID=944479 RepID=UPI00068C8FC9|nr:nucleotide exchange factor GrpE [Hippea jasoniae]
MEKKQHENDQLKEDIQQEKIDEKINEQADNTENKDNKQNPAEEDCKKEYDRLKDDYLRLYAEFDNYRKRIVKEIDEAKEATKREIIRDFLVILDNLEKAIEMANLNKDAIIEGIELSIKSFRDMLKKHGVEEINPQKEAFDPNIHDALMMQPSDELPKDTVIQTLQKGYKQKDKLIRPAKVIVSAGPDKENSTNNEKEE